MSNQIVVIKDKLEAFITARKDWMDAFGLDLDTERINTKDIWETVKKCRAMSNIVSKHLADTELLLRHIEQQKVLAEETLEDSIIEWIANQPAEALKKFAKEERRRVAMLALKEQRDSFRAWETMLSEITAFRKTLVMAMENIRGARKDILASIGAAKLENSWEPGSMGREVNLLQEAIEQEERL